MIITHAGRVARDSVLKQTSSGPTLKFGIPSEFGWGQRKNTTWLNCTVWGKRATSLAPLLTKGSMVEVSGEGDLRQYNGKWYLDISVNSVTLLSKGASRSETQEETASEPRTEPKAESNANEDFAYSGGFGAEDDIPF